uniref:DUF4346 domain-containing protein n=1 Tax=Kumanoa americana TaxID=1196377 RepID=A0A1C9CGJ0_9FLOR|nr:hypothetical protein Kuma_072 [Kumanoa americana]AOM67506.1 hypothetical protein Kuma_072 [Kumanoa americana]
MLNFFPSLDKHKFSVLRKNSHTLSFSKVSTNTYYLIQHNLDSLQVLYYNLHSLSHKNLRNLCPPIVFTAKTAKQISILLQYHNYVFFSLSSDHALYLGRELMKAEIALVMRQKYIQD